MKRLVASAAIAIAIIATPGISAASATPPTDERPVESQRNDEFCWRLRIFGITVVPYNCFEWPV